MAMSGDSFGVAMGLEGAEPQIPQDRFGALDDGATAEAQDYDELQAEAEARDYDELQVLVDMDIEYGLMRQLPWYRYD